MPDFDTVTPIPAATRGQFRRQLKGLLLPHRLVMAAVAVAGIAAMVMTMNWSWLPAYLPRSGGTFSYALHARQQCGDRLPARAAPSASRR